MAGSGRCAGLITIISGLLLLPALARRGGLPGRPGRPTTPASGPCPGAFFYGNRCYDVSTKDVQEDYDTAVERCSNLGPGGKLAVLKDAQTMDGLANILSTAIGRGGGRVDFWIGLRRKPSDRRFHFADGTPLGSFSRWITGQDPAEDDKDCVAVMLSSGNVKPKWKRFRCNKNLRYICQSEINVHQSSEESTAANSLTALTTEITTQGPQGIASSTNGHVYTYSTDGPPREPAKHEAGTPTAPPEPLTAKHRAGRGKEEKKSSVNMWLLLPGLQITGMLILMVWGTVYAWKITEGGTRPLSATSSTVSAASDVPISERIPKNFEDPE